MNISLDINPTKPLIVCFKQRPTEPSKRKSRIDVKHSQDDYDVQDPFVDDSELCRDEYSDESIVEPSHPEPEDYYVCYGALQYKQPRKRPEEQQSASEMTPKKKKAESDLAEKLYEQELKDYQTFVSRFEFHKGVEPLDQELKNRIKNLAIAALVVPGLNISRAKLYETMVTDCPLERESVQALVETELLPQHLGEKTLELQDKLIRLQEWIVERDNDPDALSKGKWTNDVKRLIYQIVELDIEVGAVERFLSHEPSKILTLKSAAYSKIVDVWKIGASAQEIGISDIGKVYNGQKKRLLKEYNRTVEETNE